LRKSAEREREKKPVSERSKEATTMGRESVEVVGEGRGEATMKRAQGMNKLEKVQQWRAYLGFRVLLPA
jgi:hypothetical protein